MNLILILCCVILAIAAFTHLSTRSHLRWIDRLNKRHDRRMLAMRCQSLITTDRLARLVWSTVEGWQGGSR